MHRDKWRRVKSVELGHVARFGAGMPVAGQPPRGQCQRILRREIILGRNEVQWVKSRPSAGGGKDFAAIAPGHTMASEVGAGPLHGVALEAAVTQAVDLQG